MRNLVTGLMFAGIGGLGLVLGADYSTGSLDAVGPGFLPRVLAWSLVALGTIIAVAGPDKSAGQPCVQKHEPTYVGSGPPPPQASAGRTRVLVCVTTGIFAFAMLIDPFGLLIAGGTLLVVGAGASQEFRWREVMVLAAGLLLFSWALFGWGLGLPIPTWPR